MVILELARKVQLTVGRELVLTLFLTTGVMADVPVGKEKIGTPCVMAVPRHPDCQL